MLARFIRRSLISCLLLSLSLALAGCGGGGGGDSAAATTASGASASSSVPSTSTSTSNSAPKISGTPANSVALGSIYSFKPTASDANGDNLSFAISGKPSWATFNTLTGALSGTASVVGTNDDIVITVTDAKGASVALPAFTITVTSSTATGQATLSWIAPTQNTDGTPLTDLAGYVIYYGTAVDQMDSTIEITSASTLSYTIGGLAADNTYYFAIASVNASGMQSARSTVGSKTIN